jgi:hypothetical protein
MEANGCTIKHVDSIASDGSDILELLLALFEYARNSIW